MSTSTFVPRFKSDRFQAQQTRPSGNPLRQRVKRLRTLSLILAMTVAGIVSSEQAADAFEISDNGDTIILMDATHDEYIAQTTSRMPAFRVRQFAIKNSDLDADEEDNFNDPLFSCILERNVDEIDVYHQVGLTAQQLTTVASNLGGDAEMMQVHAYRHNAEERYAYLAYDREGPDWTVYVDVPDEWVDDFEAQLPPDQNIVNRCYTDVYPAYMTALYKADNTETIDMRAGMSLGTFEIMQNYLVEEGFRVTSVNFVPDLLHAPGAGGIYPIFKRDGNLRYTTEAIAVGDSGSVQNVHGGQVSHMQPTWITVRGFDYSSNSSEFLVGFRGEAVWSELLNPTPWNGHFDPQLSMTPQPHDAASKTGSKSVVSTEKKSK